jgi:hypothetical protein
VVDSRRAQRLENWGWEEATGLSLRVRKSERQDSHCLRAEDGCYSSRRERERDREREIALSTVILFYSSLQQIGWCLLTQ